MKKATISIILAIIMITVVGCGAKSARNSNDSTGYSEAKQDDSTIQYGAAETDLELDGAAEESLEDNSSVGNNEGLKNTTVTEITGEETKEVKNNTGKNERKLIQTVNLTLETLVFDKYIQTLEEKVNSLGGYIETSNISKDSYSVRSLKYAEYTVRIPGEKLDTFLDTVGNQAFIMNKSSSTEDVTLSYYDSESRKKALQIQQDRLFAILDKAETMEDILALEERISDITYELEEQGTILKNYDNLVAYSTVNITIQEVKEETIIETETESVVDKMKSGLSETLNEIKSGFENVAIYVVTNLPYIIFWLAAFITVGMIGLKKYKRTKVKEEAAIKNTLNEKQEKDHIE